MNAIVDGVREDLWVKLDESDADLAVADLPRVDGDASQLRQLFQNLLENAIEYSGDSPPQVRTDASRVRHADGVPSSHAAERDGAGWVLSVADDGVGLGPDRSERAFEMFERPGRDDGTGTGIGLALCQRIVDRHDGEIWVESTPAERSTFRFTLPAADGAGDE